jgi:hypothetical protein
MTRSLLHYALAAGMLCQIAPADARPVVVELFTSQGCSSCPPADTYLGKLSARPDIVALAFHVTYWDSLGWRDRFALSESVERQEVYVRNLHLRSAYTPQLVIDGREDSLGSDGRGVQRAIEERREGVEVEVLVRDDQVCIQVGAFPDVLQADVLLVPYLRHAVSAVGRGENAGRTLEEFNIVRGIKRLGRWKGELQSFRLPVASLPGDATDVAVLVQLSGQTAIIGAAARALR